MPMWKSSELFEPRWLEGQVLGLNEIFSSDKPEQILDWARENFAPSLYYECRFSSKDAVMIHLCEIINFKPKLFTFAENKQGQVNELSQRGFKIDLISRKRRAGQDDDREFAKLRQDVLSEASGWLCGSRTQSAKSPEILSIDGVHGGILKIDPTAHWSAQGIRDYCQEHRLPHWPEAGSYGEQSPGSRSSSSLLRRSS
ncbi:hypothetical protein [Pseudobacteriovorax antillogorgiicola]|nr:hypothetical protein [Pseudobacteriovorax antillogorgiicola]